MTAKKILFVSILMFLINTPIAFAGGVDTAPPIKNYDGFFGGVGVGITATSFRYESSAAVAYFNPSPSIDSVISYRVPFSAGPSNEDFVGDLHLGYGRQLGNSDFYLGGVIGANFTTHTSNAVISNNVFGVPSSFEDRLTHKNNAHLRAVEVTVDLRPGVILSSKSLLYVVIGVAFNRLSYRVSTDFANDSIPVSYSVNSEVSKNIEGLRVGLGLQEKLSRSIALFFQYIYTRYGSLATDKEASFVSTVSPEMDDTVSASGRARPTRHSILLGADWYFSQ